MRPLILVLKLSTQCDRIFGSGFRPGVGHGLVRRMARMECAGKSGLLQKRALPMSDPVLAGEARMLVAGRAVGKNFKALLVGVLQDKTHKVDLVAACRIR